MSDLELQKIRNNLTDIHRKLNHTRCEIQRMNETFNRIATALEKRVLPENNSLKEENSLKKSYEEARNYDCQPFNQ